MKSNVLRIQVVETGRCNCEVLQAMLNGPSIVRYDVEHSSEFPLPRPASKRSGPDVVLVDFADFADGFQRLSTLIRAESGSIPIIALVDPEKESDGIKAIRMGAQDYLVRGMFERHSLERTLRTAVERHKIGTRLAMSSEELQDNEARLLGVLMNNVDGIVVVDSEGVVRFVNAVAERMFGAKASDLTEKPFGYPIVYGETQEWTVKRTDESTMVVESRPVSTSWEGKRAFLITIRDITARKQAEEELRKSEERYAIAVRGSKDGLWDWNLQTDEVYFSSRWKTMLGYGKMDIGTSPSEWFRRIHSEDLEEVRSAIAAHREGHTPHFEIECRMLHKDGTYRWMLARGTAVRDATGKSVRLAGSLSDVTERKEAEKNLRRALSDLKFALASEKVLLDELDKRNKELVALSVTDGLTGLYNHRFIQERFDFEVKRARRYDVLLSCMLLDIDHFKSVNDTYGHQFGDLVLREIANLLKANSREVDICGRYGGEEFMVISNSDEEGALGFATKLHTVIENHLFESKEHSIHVTVSIGVATYDPRISSKQELIERADMALYRAKEDGRNLIRVWKEHENREEQELDRGGIEKLKAKFDNLSNQMRATYMESTYALVRAVDAKDHYTQEHSQNVSRYSVAIGRALGLGEDELEVLKYAGLLHDIGKIGVNQEVLVKREKLTDAEFEILKRHPAIGVSILEDVRFLQKEIPIVLHHHERYDGRGYPQGLKGREIPLGARILGVADAYDAMTTDRRYKKSLCRADAVKELRRERGCQFAPEIVDAFVGILEGEPDSTAPGQQEVA